MQDEFWYAERFGLYWPRIQTGDSQPLTRVISEFEEVEPSPSPSPPPPCGGKKILEAIEKSISLPAESLRYSYEILNDYGNMSSPTILFVLQKIFNELKDKPKQGPAKIFAAAFGPGLTMETFIASYD